MGPLRLSTFDLRNFIASWQSCKFIWGQSDCCIFVMDLIKNVTDFDGYSKYIDLYDDEDSCLDFVRSLRLECPEKQDIVAVILPFLLKDAPVQEIAITALETGDIVIFKYSTTHSAGIIFENYISVLTPECGIGYLPIKNITRAWRIN